MIRSRNVAMVVVIAVVVAIGLGASYLFYGSPYARFGSEHGYNPPTFATVREIQDRASSGQPLTIAEIEILRRSSNDSDWRIRVRSLTALFYVGGTNHVPAAAEIARAKLTDKEGVVRVYALSALVRMGAPDARKIATTLLKDPEESVRERAKKALATGK